ncbi:MAG: Zn-dependent alcohol dehydrogenase [Actinobacteria bacterium]|nr:Zn-dependent alcohol dehydrogenase [Actinomycetota bacterium]
MTRAAVCRRFGAPLQIEDIEVGAAGPGEVRVRMVATAICHSDITYVDGGWGGDLPAVYGHEGAGVVEQIGSEVTSVGIGDHVVVTLIRSCGHCHGCTMGVPVTCDTTFSLDKNSPIRDAQGVALVHGLRTGAFAETTVVHESQVVRVPPDLQLDVASLLACGVITGVGAVTNTARVEVGSDVVVFGCGGVGLNSVQGALLAGARSIIAIDLADSKLAAATVFGATHVVNARAADLIDQVRAITGDRGADYVFVTVGAKAAFDASYALLAKGGAVVLVGMPPSGVFSEIDPGTLAGYNQRILGSKMGGSRIAIDIPHLVTLYQQGRLKLDELISGRFPLEDINAAIASVKSGEALRNVIVF